MAKYSPADLITGFYADETMPWSQQDCVNWLPCAAEQKGTRTQVMVKTPPGLAPMIETFGLVRGLYNAEGRLFAVMGTTLYQITSGMLLISLGTIPGTGRVRFAHNRIDGGNQVLAVSGSSGFVWNTADETFTKITDSGYPGAFDAVFIDGYLIQIEPGRRYAFHSDLSDALAYNTLDRFTSEVSPDALVAMAVANNELLLLSETTGEIFHNTGATIQPFRSKRISFDKGCAGRYAIATLGSTPFWLGNDGMFYALNGYSPQRISPRPVEQAIRDLNWAQAFAFVWETEGHSVVYWTFPDGPTFGYDVGQPQGLQWHRRASYGLERWRVNDLVNWRGDWIASDFQDNRIWQMDWTYAPLEGDTTFVSELVGGTLHDNQNTVFMPYAEFLFDTGQPETLVRVTPLAIFGNPPDGRRSYAYSYTFLGLGGVEPYTWALESGDLPDGVTLDPDTGIISGVATTAQTVVFELRLTDSQGNYVIGAFDIMIAAVPMTLVSGNSWYDGDEDALVAATGPSNLSYLPATSHDGLTVAVCDVSGPPALRIYKYITSDYFSQTISGNLPSLTTISSAYQFFAVSEDGTWVISATTNGDGKLYVFKWTGASYVTTQEFSTGYSQIDAIKFNETWTQLVVSGAFGGQGTIKLYDFNNVSGELVLSATSPTVYGTGQFFTMDWKGNYVVGSDCTGGSVITVWDATTGLTQVAQYIDDVAKGAYWSATDNLYMLGTDAGPVYKVLAADFDPDLGTITVTDTTVIGQQPTSSAINFNRDYLLVVCAAATTEFLYRCVGSTLTAITPPTATANYSCWTNPER